MSLEKPLKHPELAPPANSSRGFARIIEKLPTTVIWALAAQGILSVTRLLTSMTVGGRFGSGSEVELGYYINAFSLLMVFVAIFEAIVTTPLTVFNQRQSIGSRSMFSGHMLWTALLLIGAIGAISGVAIALQFQFKILDNPPLVAALIAVTCIAPLQLLREFSRRWLLANLEARASAFLEIVFGSLFLLGLFALVMTNQVSATKVFGVIGIVNLLGLAVWWFVYRKRFSFERSSFGKQLGENYRYGRWVAGENVCSAITMYFCTWFLTYQINEAAAGVFFACFTIVLLANPFLLGVCSILAPRAADAYANVGKNELRRVLIKFGTVIVGVLTAFSVLLWFGGEWLTTLAFSQKYADYFLDHSGGKNQITAVLGMAMPLMGISYVAAFGLLAVDRPFDNFWAALLSAIVLIVVNLSFAEPTLMTAAISFVASFAAAMACRMTFFVLALRRDQR